MPSSQTPNFFTLGSVNTAFEAQHPFSITGSTPRPAAERNGLLPKCTITLDTDQGGLESITEEELEDLVCGLVRRTLVEALRNARQMGL